MRRKKTKRKHLLLLQHQNSNVHNKNRVISSAYLHINDFEEKPRFIVDENGSKVF